MFFFFFLFYEIFSLFPFSFSKYLTKTRDDLRLEILFDRLLNLLSSSQPPETATGASLVQCLAQISIQKLNLLLNTNDQSNDYDQIYLLMNHIRHRLENEVQQAKMNLFQAAKNGPMYGCLSGINALLTIFQYEKYQTDEEIQPWRSIFGYLIDISLEIASLTSPIVSSSSPEGMMPMELTEVDQENSSTNSVTSQMLLVCCWRTMKEISFLFSRLAQISIKFILNQNQYRFINSDQIYQICHYFMEQLLKARHCGVYELAYTGFVIICQELWNSNNPELCHLPIEWIENGIEMVKENTLDRNKLCLTRRSGGLPFYLQSILIDEPIQQRGQQRIYVHKLLNTLLNIIENDSDTLTIDGEILENSRKIHAYNTVRSFYRNQRFANDVLGHIERGLHLSILGFTSSNWMIRNSSTLLLSTIVQRIFGPSKTKDGEDNFSKKNSMTSREFFNKYPSLFHLFYQQLQETTSSRPLIESLSSSSLFAILIILRRLYPSPLDGIDCSLTLEKLIPFVIKCEQSPLLRIREHSSKALLALIHPDQYSNIILERIQLFINESKENKRIHQNILHGRLLQINGILNSMKKNNLQFSFPQFFSLEEMLVTLEWCIYQNACPLTQSSYLEMLNNLQYQIKSNELKIHLNNYVQYLLRQTDQMMIGADDLTRILTRLIIHLKNNVSLINQLFIFVEQTQTELSLIETFLIENQYDEFKTNLCQWIIDLLLTMDLFNELLFTKSCDLLLKIIDRTINYRRLTRRILQLIDQMKRPMIIAASFNLLAELLPLYGLPSNKDEEKDEENLVELVFKQMNNFVENDLNDEFACAFLNVLSKGQSIFYPRSNHSDELFVQNQYQFWKLIFKISSISSDVIREHLSKVIPIILCDQRLTGVFGANPYLTQDILFEYFLRDALNHSSHEIFIDLIVELFDDLLRNIHSDDSDEQESNEKSCFDRRLWPSSEGYNNVFVSENESCDYYSTRYGQHLLKSLEKLLERSSTKIVHSIIEKFVQQFNQLIESQHEAYQQYWIKRRSTVRLNLMIEFFRIVKLLDRIQLDKLPRLWTKNLIF